MPPPPHLRSAPWAPGFGSALAVLAVCAGVGVALSGGNVGATWDLWMGSLVTLERWPQVGATLLLLAGALALALCGGLALALSVHGGGRLVRGVFLLLGKALACFPVNALAWAFIGAWVGLGGWPLWSLMPLRPDPQWLGLEEKLAFYLWLWTPPLLLLALPLGGQALVLALDARSRLLAIPGHEARRARGVGPGAELWRHGLAQVWREVRGRLPGLACMGMILLVIVEEALGLEGCCAPVGRALRSRDAGALAAALPFFAVPAALLLLVLGRRPLPDAWAEQKTRLMEGAVTIGLTPREAWRRHVLGGQVRRGLARGMFALSWLAAMAWACGALASLPPGEALARAGDAAFTTPAVPLFAALPGLLCALSFWLAGRMIMPRPPQSPHV